MQCTPQFHFTSYVDFEGTDKLFTYNNGSSNTHKIIEMSSSPLKFYGFNAPYTKFDRKD